MKLKFLLKIVTLLIFTWACSTTENIENENIVVSSSKNKILCIGDSRVEGHRPNHESYRYELWKKLVDSGKEFDFVGPFIDKGSYATYKNLSFDKDHAGIGGDTTVGVLNRYNENVKDIIPDIVLLGIGGNDIADYGASIDEVISNISSILDIIKANNANSVVIVEIIAGANPNTDLGRTFNSLISEFETKMIQLANSKSSENFKVVPVNMNENFTNNANNYADAVHYSETGAIEIANRYFTAIESFLK